MVLEIIIAVISIITLVSLHELGHFLVAKKFGVKVEEFGIGYPPRIIGKRIGETFYSLNLLPFGAFVKMPGEIGESKDPRSFSAQSVGRRILIALGGVVTFWIMAAFLFSIVFSLGAPTVVEDETVTNITDPKVQITSVDSNSPADLVGIKAGDIIKEMSFGEQVEVPSTIKEVQDFTNNHLGKEIFLTVERKGELITLSLIPRITPPTGQGPMGVGLVRTAIKKYPWYLAPGQGIITTINLTVGIIQGYGQAIVNVIQGIPSGVQMAGPVRVFQMLSYAQQMGLNHFIGFLGMISIYLAIFNILPIPALDGGKIAFLVLEGIRKKPIPKRIEYNITAGFFILLLILMVWVTINDIKAIF